MKRLAVLSLLVLTTSGCRTKPKDNGRAKASAQEAASTTEKSQRPVLPEKNAPSDGPGVEGAEKWNYPALPWTAQTDALARMKRTNRPGLVVVKGEWCPHCRRYATLFTDPEIKKLTESFELILLDSNSPDAASWSDTGTYVPRTLFLAPNGEKDPSFNGPNPKFPYFFSVSDRQRFVQALKRARDKYGS